MIKRDGKIRIENPNPYVGRPADAVQSFSDCNFKLMTRVDLVSFICIFLSLPSIRSLGSSLATGFIGTLNSRESNPRMGDPLGSSRVSFEKQNLEGVVGAQSTQYRATVELSQGCGEGAGQDMIICYQSQSLTSTRPFESSLVSGSFGTLKLSEFAREQSQEWVTYWEVLVNKTVRAWSRPKLNNIMLRWS
ncbi:hypothetical protein DVH24_034527 [Malus domestica]|uniref:Uncharacterized protein n=1 Tax=Malus domestica TaxID=3750 RepID=A0A498IZE4_MALDO|nr:hypothetical protein DVH24_034527 [Malus domestica]